MKGIGKYARQLRGLTIRALGMTLLATSVGSYAIAGSTSMPPSTSAIPNSTIQAPSINSSSGEYPPEPSNWEGDPVVNYENNSGSPISPPGVGSIRDFMIDGQDEMSPLGFEVQEDRRKLKSGEEASGLIVTGVEAGGPAAKAGLKAYNHPVKRALEAASVIASVLVPLAAPAMMLVPIMESSHVGEDYDLIIGVDGFRVSNILDFEDRMRDVQPGEIVYLSLVRNGNRMQVPVQVPGAPSHPAS